MRPVFQLVQPHNQLQWLPAQNIIINHTTARVYILKRPFLSAQGMMVLHNSAVQVHGRLKSSNCLIDSRWVCKIGDWGLSELRSPADRLPPREEYEKYNGRLRMRVPVYNSLMGQSRKWK